MEFRYLESAIIAMKGPPFTRKTEFATLIAGSLDCPLLSVENIFEVLEPSHLQKSSPTPQDLAFQVICKMARDLIWKGVSKHVVIDSSLSSASHLRMLTEMASESDTKAVRVVIVEWKPRNIYKWKMTFEKHLIEDPEWHEKWHKPKSWEDVEKAIKDFEEYDERQVEGHELVSKLVVDPLLDLPIVDMHFSDFLLNPEDHKTPSFIKAVKYMVTRYDGDDVVLYPQWRQSQIVNDGSSVRSCFEDGHSITKSTMVEGLEHEESTCMSCQRQVMRDDESYECKNCTLVLHKNCAESYDNNDTRESPFPRFRFNYEYSFPEELACDPCKQKGNDFSNECATCLFVSHLKCRLMPTVINHFDTEEHLLTIVMLPAKNNESYRCVACGEDDLFNLYLCKTSGVAYHYECINMAREVEGEHDDNHHRFSLRFSSEEAEDYLCDKCEEKRDPWLWFYSCEECAYVVHPCCV